MWDCVGVGSVFGGDGVLMCAAGRLLGPHSPAELLWVNLLNVLVKIHLLCVNEWALGAGKDSETTPQQLASEERGV